ncbi:MULTISPECIES: flagellar protein export ATPase FliI [unclassified Dyella]|uniref:flagellar protein export ATPase FliI n=1 Tax=unclassified Dyella TaxID=2634549 RepID=UPI000C82E8C5|nr:MULTISPECIES: flagellar protein export ATPase FliI [unclassified Dyella]MDR3445578.1 flagellar protein export ATPase FliI [Dyella sp.]PMQ06978.1 Flagellum-specific ATP synthase [Dyella sp. AD56]
MSVQPDSPRSALWQERLARRRQRAVGVRTLTVEGRLRRVVGLALEAEGCEAPLGARCMVTTADGSELDTEVVGFADERLLLMPVTEMHGVLPNARVRPCTHTGGLPVGHALLGRVIGADGLPLDGLGPLDVDEHALLKKEPINPMARKPIDTPLDTGVRAINSLLTVGRGQRLGLFAGSGVGKSTLLGMMTRYTDADVVVVGLIGERGREVKEFVEHTLGPEGRARSVIVAAPADAPPLKRLRGAQYATAIAEWFRDRGQRVLLLMDSITRYAQAQREIALAIGEPPATKGYPPSVFAMLPALVERAGNDAEGRGSITAFYTVLTEGDDYRHDPIADASRAILDGHIVLSRDLAEAGHYPAIDIEASISRVMPAVVQREHLRAAQRFRQVYSAYRQQRDLIAVGAYQKGSDPQVDHAIAMWPRLRDFLQQEVDAPTTLADAIGGLESLTAGGAP